MLRLHASDDGDNRRENYDDAVFLQQRQHSTSTNGIDCFTLKVEGRILSTRGLLNANVELNP